MRVNVFADLPDRSIATCTTSTYMTILKCFDKIRTRGKSNFENDLLEVIFELLEVGFKVGFV